MESTPRPEVRYDSAVESAKTSSEYLGSNIGYKYHSKCLMPVDSLAKIRHTDVNGTYFHDSSAMRPLIIQLDPQINLIIKDFGGRHLFFVNIRLQTSSRIRMPSQNLAGNGIPPSSQNTRPFMVSALKATNHCLQVLPTKLESTAVH